MGDRRCWTRAEIKDLSVLIKAIKNAIQALNDASSGKNAFVQAISILEMVATETETGVEEVIKARKDEEKTWGIQKQEMAAMISNLEVEIRNLRFESNGLQAQMDELDAKKLAHEGLTRPDVAKCQSAVDTYASNVAEIETKLTNLQSATQHLNGLENKGRGALQNTASAPVTL